MMGYIDKSILQIHEAMKKGEVTPEALISESAKRIAADSNNAFEKTLLDQASEQAASLTCFEEDNPLYGIPYVAKDNFSTKGIETTASSNVLNGYVPLFDATVIKKLADRKCVMMGKSTLDELAMGGTGTTGHKGITYNPYDPSHERMVGGSSCGSAASMADGEAVFALGSDTGDSVRKPASLAGLVGFKPTWGRISRYGLFPFAPSLDHVRFAVIKEIIDSIDDPVMKGKFNALVEALRKQGAIVEEVEFGEELLRSIYATYIVISCAEATSNDANLDGIKFGPYYGGKSYQEVMKNARTKGFSELIKRRFIIGSFALMRENQEDLFLRAQRNRAKIVERTLYFLSHYDAYLVPAAPSIAPKFAHSSDKLSSEYLIADNHLALGNFAGLPSITVPLGFEDGMPLGVNLMSAAFSEKLLLNLANKVEEVTGLGGVSHVNRKEGNL